MRPALGSQESPRSGLKYSKQKVVARTGSPEVNSFRKRAMSSHKSAQGQSGLSASGLWSWGHLLAMAVPLLMVLSSAIGPALVARSSRGLGNTQSIVLASTLLQAENSRAAPTGRRWEWSLVGNSAPKSEPLQRCVSNCASFILLIFKAKRKIQKELPQEKGIILGQQPQMKKTTRAAFHSEL